MRLLEPVGDGVQTVEGWAWDNSVPCNSSARKA